MPSFRVDHPDGPESFARYGVDRDGPWVEVHFRGVVDRYDAASYNFDTDRPILGALEYMTVWWFFAPSEVAETLSLLAQGQPVPEPLRRIVEVIENLRVMLG